MIKDYTQKPVEVQAMPFLCTPESVVLLKEFGGSSIGPITKAINTFSLPVLNIEADGVRENIVEGDYVIKVGDTLSVSSKESFESNFQEGLIGDVSDGYHTFNELYNDRCVLFAVICNTYKDVSWKSWLHSDGSMFNDYFIVGITTVEGSFTYHYHKSKWDLFEVNVLDNAPVWDGHTAADISRLLSLLKGD